VNAPDPVEADTPLAARPVLDPQAREFLAWRGDGAPPPEDDLDRARRARAASLAQLSAVAGDPESVAAVDDLEIPGNGPGVGARLYRPSLDDDQPVILFIHGGGWVTGDLDTHDVLCRGLARRAAAAVLAVDYRRSPEDRFPAALSDCWSCVEWLATGGGAFGVDSKRLAIVGDSAGGNMAAVLARWCRDRGIPCRAQILVYPILDMTCGTDSYEELATGYGLTAAAMHWYWRQYLGEDLPVPPAPDASPAHAPDLEGLPPAMIFACEADPLRDEDVTYADRLAAAGNEVVLRVQAGMVHGYFRMPAKFDRAQESWDECASFLSSRL
jgi:acetyl esterase